MDATATTLSLWVVLVALVFVLSATVPHAADNDSDARASHKQHMTQKRTKVWVPSPRLHRKCAEPSATETPEVPATCEGPQAGLCSRIPQLDPENASEKKYFCCKLPGILKALAYLAELE